MIKLQDLTPSVYYKQSRDFQFIGRLYDIVLNSIKTNSDTLYNIPLNDNTDTRLMDLMALTLGFKSKHHYNIDQLTALCKSFLTILKNKGNIQAIEDATNALLNAEGVTQEAYIETSETEVTLFVPVDLSDVNLLLDILNYILPAGIQFNLIIQNLEHRYAASAIGTTDSLKVYSLNNRNTSYIRQWEVKRDNINSNGYIVTKSDGTTTILDEEAMLGFKVGSLIPIIEAIPSNDNSEN